MNKDISLKENPISLNINKYAITNQLTAQETFVLWMNSCEPDYIFTLVFDTTSEKLVHAKRKNLLLLKQLKRRFYGKHYIRKLYNERCTRCDPAMFSFYEKHADGGYHIHGAIWEPPNPKRHLNLEFELKRIWEKVADSRNVEVSTYKGSEDIRFLKYSVKTYGKNLKFGERFEIYDWNPID